ncbi:glycosyltransferase [Runella sp.]|uniref:glycosyltransferase n=1 Tax=Runella sp. TaxID=1960881 RepID=UPI002615D5EF|nr:glycosyltransferase [Runella sp.]
MKKVTILIAARNEADNIIHCLRSVAALSYPKEHLQVLIGDDASEDETASLTTDFIKDKPHFELVHIKQLSENSKLKGKTNVLAQLTQRATGDYLFFTDADIQVPTDWIQNMLPYFKPNVGIVTGITTMQPAPLAFLAQGGSIWELLFGYCQALEWLYYLSFMRLFALFNIPITAMGNNMAVTRKAYDAVGGYESIPFSITEDYALFRAILDKGFRFVQLFDRRVLAISKPTPTLSELLIQRKRWMYGAVSIPWGQRLGVYFNGLLLPFLVVLGFFFPKITLFIIFLSYVSITAWLVGVLNWLQRPQLFIGIPFFWFYHVFINFAMLINFYLRKTTVWKGREYQ